MSFPILRIVVGCSIVSTQEYRSRVYEDISGTALKEKSYRSTKYAQNTARTLNHWRVKYTISKEDYEDYDYLKSIKYRIIYDLKWLHGHAIHNSRTWTKPNRKIIQFLQVRLCQEVGQAMGLHGELGRRGVRNVWAGIPTPTAILQVA